MAKTAVNHKRVGKAVASKRKSKSAAAAKKPKQTVSARGNHILLKSDIDAWKEGGRSPRARHNARVVEQAFRLRANVHKAQTNMDTRLNSVYSSYRDDGNGVTINHPDGLRRVMFKKSHPITSNENAERASVLLNDYYETMVMRTEDEDERNFLSFIASIIQRSKAGIRFNSQIKQFLIMQFKHPVLREAQRLLADGFDTKESKLKIYCQTWDAEGKEWITT